MTVTLNLNEDGPSKRALLDMAFEGAGLAGFDFERTAEEVTAALRKLNAMMGEWPWSLVTYNQPAYSVGLPEELSGLPANAVSAVADELSQRIAPGMGLALSAEQRAVRANTRATYLAAYATAPTTNIPGSTPLGTGRRWRRSFSPAA